MIKIQLNRSWTEMVDFPLTNLKVALAIEKSFEIMTEKQFLWQPQYAKREPTFQVIIFLNKYKLWKIKIHKRSLWMV